MRECQGRKDSAASVVMSVQESKGGSSPHQRSQSAATASPSSALVISQGCFAAPSFRHSINDDMGTIPRWLAKGFRKAGLRAAVSDRALNMAYFWLRSLAQCGVSHQYAVVNSASPSATRTNGTDSVGATFTSVSGGREHPRLSSSMPRPGVCNTLKRPHTARVPPQSERRFSLATLCVVASSWPPSPVSWPSRNAVLCDRRTMRPSACSGPALVTSK